MRFYYSHADQVFSPHIFIYCPKRAWGYSSVLLYRMSILENFSFAPPCSSYPDFFFIMFVCIFTVEFADIAWLLEKRLILPWIIYSWNLFSVMFHFTSDREIVRILSGNYILRKIPIDEGLGKNDSYSFSWEKTELIWANSAIRRMHESDSGCSWRSSIPGVTWNPLHLACTSDTSSYSYI